MNGTCVPMAKILILEDDPDLAQSIVDSCVSKHHIVEQSNTVANASDRLAVSDYDILVLDWNLPDGEGIDVLRVYRQKGGLAPVLMLTAKAQIIDKEEGFAAGADDYLTKPFSRRELEMRIEALLRRPRDIVPQLLKLGNIALHTDTFRAFKGTDEVRLLPKEFALLAFLMRHAGQIFSTEHLLERVWSSDSESMEDTVVTTVKRLRRKIDEPGLPSIIQNIRGVGYRVSVEEHS